jgi:hypothetical protein
MLYGMMISMTVFLMKRNRKALIWSLVFLLSIMIYAVADIHITEKQNEIVVFDIGNHSVVGLVKGREMLFLTDMPDASEIAKSFGVKNYLVKSGIRRIIHVIDLSEIPPDFRSSFSIRSAGSNIFFRAGDLRGLLVNDYHFPDWNDGKRLPLDCIVLSHNVKVSKDQLTNLFAFKWLILDSSNRFSYRLSWLNMNLSDHYSLHSVADHKAIVINSDNKIIKKN